MFFLIGFACCWLHFIIVSASHLSDVAFFNHANLNSVTSLNLRLSPVAFSFRSCSGGALFVHWGSSTSNNRLSIMLTTGPKSLLQIDWKVDGILYRTMLGNDDLANNRWHTMELVFDRGSVRASVRQGASPSSNVILANSTWQSSLLDVNWRNISLEVGSDLLGCLQGGPGLPLAPDGSSGAAVTWNSCPLDTNSSICGNCV